MKGQVRTRATTSFLPGTTLASVRFPLDGGGFLADSPGVLAPDQLATRLTTHELRLVQPTTSLRPATYELQPGRAPLLGGLGRLDLLTANCRLLLTMCVGPKLPLHVTPLHRADVLLAERWGRDFVQPPILSVEELEAEGSAAPWFRGPDRLATLRPRAADAVAIRVDGPDAVELLPAAKAPPRGDLTGGVPGRQLPLPDREARSFVDVVFPGIGWIALTGTPDVRAELRAITCPGASLA